MPKHNPTSAKAFQSTHTSPKADFTAAKSGGDVKYEKPELEADSGTYITEDYAVPDLGVLGGVVPVIKRG